MALAWIATQPGSLDSLELVEVEVPPPAVGEVTIEVRAVGMNPADYKAVLNPNAKAPLRFGYEVAGVIVGMGPDTELASGGGAVGDEVLAFRISGGYASAVTVPAEKVFAKPESLGFPEAANLLLAGATAADVLSTADVGEGDVILVHGASGAVGVSLLQQAALLGAHVIGTASANNFDVVREFGGEPIAYGPGLADRVREAAPHGIDAALDMVGTDEAIDVSLELVADRSKIVTIAAHGRASTDGFTAVGGMNPESALFRDGARARLIELVGSGQLVVPVAKTFPLAELPAAFELLRSGHPGGKLALIP